MDAVTLADVVLGALAVETLALYTLSRRTPHVPPFRTWLPTLAAGTFLALALRSTAGLAAAVQFVDLSTIGSWLALAGVAHACDLVQRVRAYRAPVRER